MNGYELIILIIVLLFVILWYNKQQSIEGFTSLETLKQCGVGLPDCSDGERCMNGFCRTDKLPEFPLTSGLPVFPQGYSR